MMLIKCNYFMKCTQLCILFPGLLMGLLLWILLDNSIADQNYLNNDSYRERTAVYKNYRDEKNIVMLGDSLTYRTNWAMVLNQASVSNMGIDNDITE